MLLGKVEGAFMLNPELFMLQQAACFSEAYIYKEIVNDSTALSHFLVATGAWHFPLNLFIQYICINNNLPKKILVKYKVN